MKSEIYSCVLVVLVCYAAFCHGVAKLEGNCQPNDVAEDLRNKCRLIQCTKNDDGNVDLVSVACGLVANHCPPDVNFTIIHEPAKTYPDCCHHFICH